MENYLLCGEIGLPPQSRGSDSSSRTSNVEVIYDGSCVLYKGRRKGSVDFVGIWRHSKTRKDLIANGVCIMHSLDHVNVLKFLEWYETPKHIWVITELATGGSLADLLEQDGSVPPPHLDVFVNDIVRGLHYLHSSNVLYCDLQPRKILLDNCEALKLSDFTLAQSIDSSDSRQLHYDFRRAAQIAYGENVSGSKTDHQRHPAATETAVDSESVPSPFYTAPELFEGGKFGKASDLWSLGVLMYELCTGQQPFHGSSSEELIYRVCEGEADMKQLHSAAAPAGEAEATVVVQVVAGLLQQSPESRSWEKLLQKHLFEEQ